MNAYPFKELIKRWQTERLTTEQAIGQILLHLQALSARLQKLERRVGQETSPPPQSSPSRGKE